VWRHAETNMGLKCLPSKHKVMGSSPTKPIGDVF